MKPDITLIFPSSPFLLTPTMFPPLGIMYLSAYLKEHGIKVQCLDMSLPGHTREMAEADIIGISFSTPQRQEAFELAKYYRELGKITIAGGPHPTHMMSECHDFDVVVEGRGEESLLSFLTEDSVLPYPFAVIPPLECPDPDSYPFPDRECLPIDQYRQDIEGQPVAVLIAARGCPYGNCSFCANIKQKFSAQSAERTLSEIFMLNEKYGYTVFTIYDDTFAYDRHRLKIMADDLEHKDFKFRCFVRADHLSEEACFDLSRMGATAVGIGVESGSDEILKTNMKGTSRRVNTRAIENLRSVKIDSKAFLIVGLPGETEESVRETAKWIEAAKPDDIAVSVFQPLPGSAIFKNPEKWGVSFKYDSQPMWYRGKPGEYSPTIRTETLTTERIAELRDWLEKTFKDPELLK